MHNGYPSVFKIFENVSYIYKPDENTKIILTLSLLPPPTKQILQRTKNVVTFDKYPIFSRVKLKLMAGHRI